MTCPFCYSDNVRVETVQEYRGGISTTKTKSKYKEKRHGFFWFIFIGWWWWIIDLMLWVLAFIPRALLHIGRRHKYAGTSTSVTTQTNDIRYKTICTCQNCGKTFSLGTSASRPAAQTAPAVTQSAPAHQSPEGQPAGTQPASAEPGEPEAVPSNAESWLLGSGIVSIVFGVILVWASGATSAGGAGAMRLAGILLIAEGVLSIIERSKDYDLTPVFVLAFIAAVVSAFIGADIKTIAAMWSLACGIIAVVINVTVRK